MPSSSTSTKEICTVSNHHQLNEVKQILRKTPSVITLLAKLNKPRIVWNLYLNVTSS